MGIFLLEFPETFHQWNPNPNSPHSNFQMPLTEQPQMSQSSLRSCTINLCRLTFRLHHCQSASSFGIKEVYTPGGVPPAGQDADNIYKIFLMKIKLSFPDLKTSGLQALTCHYLQIGFTDVQSKGMQLSAGKYFWEAIFMLFTQNDTCIISILD